VSTGEASSVTESVATLAGAIDPHGWNTRYHVEYGTSTGYGSVWPTVDTDMGALVGAQAVAITIQGLQPAMTYHYRLVAGNPGGTTYGADRTFTTSSYPLSVIQVAPIGAPLGVGSVQTSKSKAKPKASTRKHKKASRKAKRKRKK
jgi:hypothetical protein